MTIHRLGRVAAFVIIFMSSLSGCNKERESLLHTFEGMVFKSSGVILLSNPTNVSIKELRLTGNKIESEVVIEGRVEERSENSTYFVISDDTARMLVVTTDLLPRMSAVAFQAQQGATVKVIGRVEIGKKGLPFLKASAITTAGLMQDAKPRI